MILEACTSIEPAPGFLADVQKTCKENGAVFILDEMITGFRWDLGGAQKLYGIKPDLSTFGKSIGNGFSIGALVGKREIMERGGIEHGHERVFLLSLTHGAENHCLAAAIECMHIYKRDNVVEQLHKQGERLRKGINQAIQANRLEGYFEVLGRASNLVYATRDQEKNRRSHSARFFFRKQSSAGWWRRL